MKKLIASAVSGLALMAVLTACSGSPSSQSSQTPSSSADASLTKLVPADIASSGTIDGGANFQAPPFAMYAADGKTPSGAMIGIVTEAAHRLGLKVDWSQVAIADQTPALQAGKIVLTGSATAANPDIIKQVNVVGVFQNLQGFFTQAGSATKYKTIDDICGKSVSVGKSAAGTIAILNGVSGVCTQDGKPAIKQELLDGTADIVLAVQSGRADAGILSTASVAATVQQSSGMLAATDALNQEVASKIPSGGEGFTIAKSQTKLAKAFQAAVQSMIDDGAYAKIMNSFNVPTSLFYKTATLNDGSTKVVSSN